jgi:hypothetical protein
MAVKNDVAVRLGVIFDAPGDHQERRRLTSCPGRGRKLCVKGVKGIVQRKLRWVDIGINRQLLF